MLKIINDLKNISYAHSIFYSLFNQILKQFILKKCVYCSKNIFMKMNFFNVLD